MRLQEKLDAMKNESKGKIPPETVQILLQEIEDLVQSGIADQAISIGETMPAFTLPDEKGHSVSSDMLLEKGPLAISFYRGVW